MKALILAPLLLLTGLDGFASALKSDDFSCLLSGTQKDGTHILHQRIMPNDPEYKYSNVYEEALTASVASGQTRNGKFGLILKLNGSVSQVINPVYDNVVSQSVQLGNGSNFVLQCASLKYLSDHGVETK